MFLPDNKETACCQEDDLERLSQVYARYEQAVFLHAYYLLGRREQADNVKQETFLYAYRALDKLGEEAHWKPWLLKTCTGLCRNQLPPRQGNIRFLFRRRAGNTPAGRENEDQNANAAQASASRAVLRALRQMPLEPRNLIALSELEGYTPAEIASIVGCSLEALWPRLWRARRLFQKQLSASI